MNNPAQQYARRLQQMWRACRLSAIMTALLTYFVISQSFSQAYSNPDSLVQAVYKLLSGQPGARDWNLYKSFFHEKAILGSVIADAQGKINYRSFTPAEYCERNDSFFRSRPFSVRETYKTTQQFGGLIHIFSTYEFSVDNAPKSGRGINSFQLIYDHERWWIISLQYINERPDLPLPKNLGGG